MLGRKLYYLLNSGKNSKFKYFFKNYMRLLCPNAICRIRREHIINNLSRRCDMDYVMHRVNYYNKLSRHDSLASKWHESMIGLSQQEMCKEGKVYFFDSYEYSRFFRQDLRWKLLAGDIVDVPSVPSIVKSRPLVDDNEYSVLLNMDKVRHFIFVNDKKSFEQKKNMAVFRGKIGVPGSPMFKENRYRFMKQFMGNPLCDLGEIKSRYCTPEWVVDKMTIGEHLDFKFILALEGNDVASNLKWVMSSNSLAVMPHPTCETWFMEGKLVGGVHYVEIRPDFSDLEEKMQYYIDNPSEAQKIIENAHRYVAQFRDKKRERLISLLVMKKYLSVVNPGVEL